MDTLYIESDYIKNMLKDDTTKNNDTIKDIEQILKDAYELLKISTITYEEYKDFLLNFYT